MRGWFGAGLAVLVACFSALTPAGATEFTMNVPGTSLRLPTGYPEAGGVAIVMVGANGNAYYQFSDPTGAFQGYNNNGTPVGFRGNPFTINNPIALDCGASTCATYFGGSIAEMYVRFTAQDGDTGAGEFDNNDISLRVNGFTVSNWSTVPTEITNTAGTVSAGFRTGFTNNTYNTGWVSTTDTALLSNILTVGTTTSQIFDRDPNDNYWDFRIGNPLTNLDIVTVAPGYDLTKTSPSTAFATVGQVITYNFVIRNIGSVPIRSLTLNDDKIGSVTCSPTTLLDVNFGQTPNQALCSATYAITQADIDAGSVTNNAVAQGTPDFGVLGQRRATLTIPGPTRVPSVSLDKSTTATAFGNAGTTVPYRFRVQNTGNVTLTNVVVTDPLLPGLSCTFATMLPNAINICNATYTVTQANVDAWGTGGTLLANTATVNARSPLGALAPVSDTQTLPGPTRVVTLTLDKAAQLTPVTRAGDVIPYRFTLRNTGNLTWPAPPAITDPLITGGVSCPAGAVAPGASVICTANYTVTQANIDAGQVVNTAQASITVGGITATASDTETVPATRIPSFTFDKRLAAASPTSFNNAGVVLAYEFAFTNTGNTTLNALTVSDALIPTVTCPASVAPGATAICTGSYTTTQADLEAGQVRNTATPRVTPAGGAALNGTADSVTVPAVQSRSASLDKTAPAVTPLDFVVGGSVTYSYFVTNTGNVALPGPLQVSDDRAGTFQCQAGGLARGASVTCTRAYTYTDSDIAAGSVTNVASASFGGATPVVTNSDSVTIAPTTNPAISLVKVANPTTATSTATPITYTFTVTNSGNVQIVRGSQPITINDPRAGTVTCNQPNRLNVGASFTCTATTTPTQAEVDAGTFTNRATASFSFTRNGVTSTFTTPEATATVSIPASPAVDLAKSGPANFTTVGSTVPYGFTITNTGNVTLTTGSVSDPRIPGLSCSFAGLLPGGTRTCSGSSTVTQADVDAGLILNTATVTAATPGGGSVSDTASVTTPVNPGDAFKALTLDKVASVNTFRVGQQITYTFRVTNTGTQTLVDTVVTDANFPAFSCTIPTIAPGASNASCVYNYTAQQSDVDAGSIVNAASATAPGAPVAGDSVTVPAVPRNSSYTFTKTADGPFTTAGDPVTFTLRVRNTGNTTLTNVVITDAFFDPDLSCTIPTLAPGAADASCTAIYTDTQADVDAGRITNSAAISVTPPPGLTPIGPATATAVVPGPTAAPGLAVTKVPSSATYVLGQTITYDFSVENTGNVTLTGGTFADAQLGFTCTLPTLLPGDVAVACANATPLQATRVMTQADIDAASFTNTAEAEATSAAPGGGTVSDGATVTVTGPAQAPALTLAKTANPTTYATVGQVVTYSYLVTNSGNITVTAPVTIADDRIATVTCLATPAAGIAPGATLTCSATFRVAQADLDAGSVTNVATASTVQPVVPLSPGDPTSVTVTSPSDTATVTATQSPALRLEKRVADGSPSTFDAVGDQITYLFTITNTGNVTTTAPITIDDDQIGTGLACTAGLLAPGQTATCTQVWTATQDALDAGQVTNTATATTSFGGNPVVSPTDSVTVPAQRDPAITIAKTLVAPIPLTFSFGQVLNYSYLVTNSGNVTLGAPFAVTDNLTTPTCASVPATLVPGGSFTCTASYTIGTRDLELGSTTNTAEASATFDGNPVESAPDSVTFPLSASPALSIDKTAPAGPMPAVGQTVTYSYLVTNSGDGAFIVPVTVSDNRIPGAITCWTPVAGDLAFNPDETASCTAVYTITQADRDRGFVVNTATAQSTYAPGGDGIPVESPVDSLRIEAATAPALTLAKSVTAGANPAAAGDVLTYGFVITNSGDQTLFGLDVSDPLIPTLSCSAVSLAPADTLTCSGSYAVTQADIDTGASLVNTATVRGTSPQGVAVSTTGGATHPLAAPAPAVEVTKVVEPDPLAAPAFSGPGEVLTFRVTVRNTGNVTLDASSVTDALDPTASCAIGVLAPGEDDRTCTFTYTTTQADVDRLPGPNGGVLNTVAVTSAPRVPGSADVTDTGTLDVLGPVQEPAFSLAKTATQASFDAAGDEIAYTYAVTNAGNVTLFAQPVVTDDRIATVSCDPIPATGLAPGTTLICRALYTVTQGDVNAGSVTNIATVSSTDLPVPTPAGTATETVPSARAPALSVEKLPSILTGARAGDTITYTYTLTNTGNVTLTAVTPSDAHVSAAGTTTLTLGDDRLVTDADPLVDSSDAGADGVWDNLQPGDVVTFTADYLVTQADVDAGADLTNTVTVSATGPPGVTVPDVSTTATVPVDPATPAIDVQKRADTSGLSVPAVPGDVIAYEITVENTGNLTLSEPVLADSLLDGNGVAQTGLTGPTYQSGDTDGDLQLSVGETWFYGVTIAVTQESLDSGGLSNSVTATATTPSGTPVTDLSDDDDGATDGPDPGSDPGDDPTLTPFDLTPQLAAVKSATIALGADGIATPGDVISYAYVITNTGNVTLRDVVPVETGFQGSGTAPVPTYVSGGAELGGDPAIRDLAPGASVTYSATYALLQADVDRGEVANQATASGTAPDGTLVEDPTGATSGDDAPTVTPFPRLPALVTVKTDDVTALSTPPQVGETVAYTITVENTGNVTLPAPVLVDTLTDANGGARALTSGPTLASGDDGDGVLQVGEVWTYEASFELTQAVLDAGGLSNTVTATATDPVAGPVSDTSGTDGTNDTPTVTPLTRDGAIRVVKSSTLDLGANALADVGDVITYTHVVTNGGNVTLFDIAVAETLFSGTGATPTPAVVSGGADLDGQGDDIDLRPGESATYQATYALTQADLDAGTVTNQSTASGATPGGPRVTDRSGTGTDNNTPNVTTLPSQPAISGEKTLLAAPTTLGGRVEFLITATNTGNVTLTGVEIASERLLRADGTALTLTSGPVFDGATFGSPDGSLLPNETARYLASYVLTQADIDAGGISNAVILRGSGPGGLPVTDLSDNGIDSDGNTTDDPTRLPIVAAPAMTLAKTLDSASGPTFQVAGQVLDYRFTVTNTGNVTLTEPITVDDPLITGAGGAITCPAPPLAPLASITCTASYTVTQADVDRGSLTNTASATDGTTTTPTDSVTVPARQTPGLSLLKTARPVAPGAFVVGAVVTYDYVVTNSGNVTVTAPVNISDNRIAAVTCPALPAGGLLPAATLTCTATYTVTGTDVGVGSVTNLATATDGTTTSPIATETIPDGAVPALSIVKEVPANATFAGVGDVLTYTYRVTNSGSRAFVQPVTVTDDRIAGPIACFTASATDPDLRPGETVTCSADYTVTQADIDGGQVTNQAFAQTTLPGAPEPIVSPAVAVTVPATEIPELFLEKSVSPDPVPGVGTVLTYSFLVTNSGNQTLTDVQVSDPLLPGLVCKIASLAPAERLSCTDDSYVVTQADIDRGTLVNTATATAINPRGGSTSDTDSATATMPVGTPGLTLTKTAIPSPFGPTGSALSYRLTLRNTGTTTLSAISVSDPLIPGFACTIPTLAPGAVDTTCVATTTVTQAQTDAGAITNTASATATDPAGATITDSDTITTPGPAATPRLEATKVLLPSGGVPGSRVSYGLTLRNAGNVTLTGISVTDTMTRINPATPVSLDAPFALVSGDAGGDGIMLPGEVWVYTASRTLTQDDVNAGGLSNSVTATGSDPTGGPVTDTSDNGIDTDGNSTDDPTVFAVPTGPALVATKVVTGPAPTGVGQSVTFTITALNTGNTSLSNLTVADTLTRADGSALGATVVPVSVPDPLQPGATASWTVTHVLTQADIDAGGIRNTVTVTGTTPGGGTVTDTSDDGDPTDGNTEDDPTEVLIPNAPGIEAVKTLTAIGDALGEQAEFSITVENTGNTTLTAVTVADQMTRIGGTPVAPVTTGFVSATQGSPEGALIPGEVATYRVFYTLVQADIDAGGLSNQATATGQPPTGPAVSDLSDNDAGLGEDDPTTAPIARVASLAVTKAAGSVSTIFPTVERVTFTITVENTGNVTQTNLRVTDDLRGFVAPATLLQATYPVTTTATGFAPGTANPAYDGSGVAGLLSGPATLAPGASGTISITLTYSTASGQPAGDNVAFASSPLVTTPVPSNPVGIDRPDTDGDGVPDVIDGPGDRDGDGIPNELDYDPTGTFYCEDTGRILPGGSIRVVPLGGGAVTLVRNGADGTYQFFVTEGGLYRLEITYPPGTLASLDRLSSGTLDPTGGANPLSVGSSPDGATGFLADFAAGANPWFDTFRIEPGDPFVINNNIPVAACIAGAQQMTATKVADRGSAVLGETVNFTLTFTNGARAQPDVSLIDRLPVGLIYTPGSALLNGAAVEPAVSGQSLTWGPRSFAPGEVVTLRLSARVSSRAGYGDLVNSAIAISPAGTDLSNTATATVRIVPEAVFDCTDVIGKVFDDRNRNGVQDFDDPRAEVTDQDIFVDGKFGTPRPEELKGEPGIPGVRLVTVNGLLITTDEFGRYHVPCAALPADIGSNFTLKLDTRSLPVGFALTTENPRTLRLTPGKIAKMNFGVTLTETVEIGLTAQAFVPGTTDPVQALTEGIATLVARIADTPSTLRLTYLLAAGEDQAGALARLRATEDLIRRAWRGVGTYALQIDKSVSRP